MSLSRLLSLGLLALLGLPLCAQDKTGSAAKLDSSGEPLPAGAIARLGTMRFRHPSLVNFVAYSGDGNVLITLSGETSLRFWDARTGKELSRLDPKVNSRRIIYGGSGPSILLSGDGKTIAYGVDDGDCTIIDVATGKTVKEFKVGDGQDQRRFSGDQGPKPQLSHDGRLLVVIDGAEIRPESKISVWDTTTGKLVHQHLPKMKGDSFTGATFSRDGKTLVRFESANRNKVDDKGNVAEGKAQLRFVEAATGKEIRSIACSVPLGSDTVLTADGKHLIGSDRINQTDGNGRSVNHHLIDAITGKEVHKFSAKFGNIRARILTADQKSVFVACVKQITQYDLKTGNVLKELPIGAAERDENDDFDRFGRLKGFSAAISPDGKTLVVAAQSSVAFWDVPTGKETPIDPGHRNRIDSVAFGPHGKQLLTGSADGGLYLWDVAGGSRVRTFAQKASPPDEEKRMPRGGGGERLDLFKVRGAFSPDGKNILGLWWGEKLHIWDATTGKLQHHLGDIRGSTSFSYSPDGRTIALAGADGSLGLWHADSGREAKSFVAATKVEPNDLEPEFGPFSQGAYSTAFSADGRTLICGAMEMEPRGLKVHVKHWEVTSGQARATFVTRMNFDGGPQFDLITAALDTFIVGFHFSPDGKSILESGFANAKLRNLRSGAEIRSFGGKQITAQTTLFSPDGKMLIAGKHDGAVRVWDVATGTVLVDFPAHPTQITALTFSLDGKWLASGARDSGLLIWDWQHIRAHALASQQESTPSKTELLWADLADKDAARAYSAIKALATDPAQSVGFLKARLRPIPPVDAKHLKKLLDDLDHPQYPVRQKADEALEKLGDLAAPAIKERRANNPSVETARRLETLQKKLDAQVLPLEVLQVLRATEVLELIGSPEARDVIDGLAKGARGHRITEDARDSLRRLSK